MKTYVILNDIHFPFHDRVLFDLVLPFIKERKPDGITLNGDIVDMFQLSAFDKNPLTKTTVKTEQVTLWKFLKELRDIPDKIYKGGNHEDRWRRYLWANARALVESGVVEFEKVFQLPDHGFQYFEYGEKTWIGKLLIVHGDIVRKHSGMTARGNFEKYGCSVMCGHTHRMGSYYHTNINGPHVCFENGHLSNVELAEYVKDPDWQQGFSMVQVMEDGVFSVEQIPILSVGNRKEFIYGGRRYRTVPRKS